MVGGVSRGNAIEDLFRFIRRGGADVAAVEGEQRSIAFVALFQFGGRPVHDNAAVFEEQHTVGTRNTLMSRTVLPSSVESIVSRSACSVAGSRPAKGSSSITIAGLERRMRASAMR